MYNSILIYCTALHSMTNASKLRAPTKCMCLMWPDQNIGSFLFCCCCILLSFRCFRFHAFLAFEMTHVSSPVVKVWNEMPSHIALLINYYLNNRMNESRSRCFQCVSDGWNGLSDLFVFVKHLGHCIHKCWVRWATRSGAKANHNILCQKTRKQASNGLNIPRVFVSLHAAEQNCCCWLRRCRIMTEAKNRH